ncbi:dTDP-glucose 4,6-dehydratase [Costertonia aggregata]|uniref:dTDP-glucose 4,6-dehydratase n=1 Tax=Costertonia aggregata TaxID=343403 RepID=A0A7H9APD8_9FLAO|nr:dTDP-glucose 4,6-dehydratase [Costertonia aggregata]QLG45253.1 dTDP-glucose 4,6-dehydratase [Costertonia aggregata]
MTTLVTGGAGFIGSNFIPYFLDKNPNTTVINLDKLTYAGDLNNLDEVSQTNRYRFVQGDICNQTLIDSIFTTHKIDSVIHFAAESHVDKSISNPDSFIKTNIEGTYTLLEAARKHWGENNQSNRFHHISTDEVYGSLGDSGFFNEKTPYAPNSPYSASKAASDFLVRSYYHTFKLNTITTNCSNNYGPKQHDEKLIPTIIRTALQGSTIPIYGKGTNVRDWLYVLDHCKGIDTVFKKGRPGETYLIGGNNESTNLSIAEKICSILDELLPKAKGSYKDQIAFVEDRKGHDHRYAIDASKIGQELHWRAVESFDTGLQKTIKWYLSKYKKNTV